MDALLFVLSIAGIGLVMWWLALNDQVGPDKPTRGLLAMTEGNAPPKRRRRGALELPAETAAAGKTQSGRRRQP